MGRLHLLGDSIIFITRARALIAVAVFIGWVLITAFAGRLWTAVPVARSIDQLLAHSVRPNFVLAVLFLFGAIALFRWRDVGLTRPKPGSLRVLWFPGLYILCFVSVVAWLGLPPIANTLFILANTMLVGVSEELACRGVLYQGLRGRFGLWPAALASSMLFGAVHILNGFTTGDFTTASIQAITASMTGIAFVGIRIRTGSLYPGILLHGLWDFTLVATLFAVTALAKGHGGTPPSLLWIGIAPVLLILPNFVYGILLIRRAAHDAVQQDAASVG